MSFVSTHFTWNALNPTLQCCLYITIPLDPKIKSNCYKPPMRTREVACHLISFAHTLATLQSGLQCAGQWRGVESTMWLPNVYRRGGWAIGSLINQRSELTFSLASVWLMLIGQSEGRPGFDIQPNPSPDAILISHSTPFS